MRITSNDLNTGTTPIDKNIHTPERKTTSIIQILHQEHFIRRHRPGYPSYFQNTIERNPRGNSNEGAT